MKLFNITTPWNSYMRPRLLSTLPWEQFCAFHRTLLFVVVANSVSVDPSFLTVASKIHLWPNFAPLQIPSEIVPRSFPLCFFYHLKISFLWVVTQMQFLTVAIVLATVTTWVKRLLIISWFFSQRVWTRTYSKPKLWKSQTSTKICRPFSIYHMIKNPIQF